MKEILNVTLNRKPQGIIVGNLKEAAYEIRKYLYGAMAGHEGTIYSPPYRNTVEVMDLLRDEWKINENYMEIAIGEVLPARKKQE
jgi:hypothetical protein